MLARLQRYFISGLIVFLPLALTVYVFFNVINWADGLLGKYLEPYFEEKFGVYFLGLGIIIGVYLIIVIGFLATNFFGKKIHAWFENLLLKLPFFRQVYSAFKEVALFLFSREKLAFKQVVIIEYPRKGLFSFGFFTNETAEQIRQKTRQELCNVFIPSAPGPVTGYVIMVPKRDIIFTEVTVEEAIKFIISGGVVNPSLR